MSFNLQSLVSASNVFPPQWVIVYGVQGIGKTTFASTFESPILLRTEDGAGAIDIPTFPVVAHSMGDVYQAIQSLHEEHPFKTLIVDSLDWLEPLVHQATCQNLQSKNIEDVGYGKGYIHADDLWREIMAGLDSLRHTRGMQIVCIAHSEIKTYNAPDGDPYDRYQMRIHKRPFALWQEWADMVLFCNYKRNLVKQGGAGDKKRAEGSGEQVIFTQERPAFMAKNRWCLPEEIFIGKDSRWFSFHDALEKGTNGKYPNPINTTQTQ